MSTYPPTPTRPQSAKVIKIAAPMVLVAVAATIAVVVASLLILPKQRTNGTVISSFCCPEEAKEMLPAMNLSANPCDSFYGYVCLNTIKYGLWPSMNSRSSIEKNIATGTNLQNNSAAIFLSNLFKTCASTIWKKVTLAEQLAQVIADMGKLKYTMTRSEILFYFLETSLRLGFYSVLDIQRHENNSLYVELSIDHEAPSLNNEDYRISVKAAVQLFNFRFGTNISVDEVAEFAALVAQKLDEHPEEHDEEETVSWLTLKEWKRTLISTGWPSLQNITNLHVYDAPHIELFLSLIFREPRHQVGLVFVLTHSIMSPLTFITVELQGTRPGKPAFDRCFELIDRLFVLKDQMYTGILASPAKERHIKDLYQSVVEAVATDIKRSSSFDEEQADNFLRRLQELTFVVPSQRLVSLAIPPSTGVFAKDFCEGNRYEFRANELRQQSPYIGLIDHSHPLSYTGGKYVQISPAYFNFLRFNTPNRRFLNMPTIGVHMAVTLWEILLGSGLQSKEMTAKIGDFYKCFQHVYLSKREMTYLDYSMVIRALGINTVLGALNHSGWHEVKTAWSLFKMSASQLFYLRETFYRCPFNPAKGYEESFNIPLRYTRDFGKSFQCDSDSPMARTPSVCVF